MTLLMIVLAILALPTLLGIALWVIDRILPWRDKREGRYTVDVKGQEEASSWRVVDSGTPR